MIVIKSAEEKILIKSLTVIVSIFVILNIINALISVPSLQIARLIDLDLESNLTTWFSSMLLAIAAFFAYKCSLFIKPKAPGKRMWQLLSLGLLGMSCDETAMIHENLGQAVNKYIFKVGIFSNSSWSVLLGPLITIILFIFAIRMKRYLKGSTRAIKLLIAGTLIYIVGAFMLESATNLLTPGNLEWLWRTMSILEETFEMTGTLLIIAGLIEYRKFLSSQN
ncbi:hypothetical protein ACFL2J_05795 [Candidatus Omnitrophota bacterium]